MTAKSIRTTVFAAVLAAFVAIALAPFAAHWSPSSATSAQSSPTQAFAFSNWSGEVKGDVLDTAIIKLRPHDYHNTVNIHNDGYARGDVIYLYNLGTTSKWKLENVKGTNYYFIEAFLNFSGRLTPRSYLMDVDGQSKKSGAIVHSWNGKDEKTYSRQWKFVRQSDGTFLIINRNSGLYLSLEGTPSDTENHKLAQSSTPMHWDMEIVGVDNYRSPSYLNDYGIINRYSTFPGGNWMKDLPDSAKLTELSIPGAHDAGTCHTYGDIAPQDSFTACQQYYLREQLGAGVRYFDIRLGIDGIDDRDPYINHGGTVCETESGYTLQLSQVIDYFKRFLHDNPTEFVIMLASHSGGDTKNQAKSLDKFIQENPGLFYLQTDSTIPTVGDLRGKIYLAHRLDLNGTGYGENDLGLNLSSWGSHDYATDDYTPVKITTPTLENVYVQDNFDTNATDKIKYVSGSFRAASESSANDLYINYTSCTKNNPFTAARNMNYNIYEEPAMTATDCKIGITVMDFIDAKLAYHIYRRNPGVYESVQPLMSAPLTGQSTQGTWIFDGKWWFAHHDGSYTKNGWELINDKWYAFDSEGWMRTGWHLAKGKWYYLDPESGSMATGWQLINGAWYYLDPNSGAMQTGWQLIEDTWYYFHTTSGALQSGWLKDGATWYYLNPSHDGTFGAMQTGWLLDRGTWYYLKANGAMATKWVKVDDTWYYANKSGALQSGWLLDRDTWYYLDPYHNGTFGAMQTGWLLDRGTWYYLEENGAMATDAWIDDYYVNDSGAWDPNAVKEPIVTAPGGDQKDETVDNNDTTDKPDTEIAPDENETDNDITGEENDTSETEEASEPKADQAEWAEESVEAQAEVSNLA